MQQIKGREYPMVLAVENGRIVGLKDKIIETAFESGNENDEAIEQLEKKVLVKCSQYTTGRGKGNPIVPATWIPNELEPFCENPDNVELPRTVHQVSLVRPMDIDKINAGDPKGEALLGFKSHLPQSFGDDKVRIYLTGYSFENAVGISNFEEGASGSELGNVQLQL